MKKKRDIAVQPPLEDRGPRLEKPKTNSVGLGAIKSSAVHVQKYMDAKDAVKLSLKMNQKGGFDCPGCAWPDPDDDRSALGEYCENGIKAIAEEATNKRITADFFKNNSVEDLSRLTDFELGKLGRLTEPMVLKEGSVHYEPIEWDEAFRLIASELNGLPTPDDALFYTSGRTSNEAAFLYQLFVRTFGTNNLPDCSNMCHESSGQGLSRTVGIGKGSVTLQDIYEAEVVMVMGQNPGTNHPRMLSALEKCKENGGKIITVNPLPEAGLMRFTDPQSPLKILKGGTSLTDVFLPVRINGDVAFLKAVMLILLEKEEEFPGTILDHDFINKKTKDYADFIKDLKKYDINECIVAAGLERKTVEAAADLIAQNQKIIICWAMGLTQHENGVANIQEVVNLLLMKGAIGKAGAGTCPVRGHSNVQGDRTMGIWEAPKDEFLDKLDAHFGIKSPREHGLAVVPAIKAMYEEAGKVFFAMGGNFLSATPDTEYTAKALQNCRMTVQVSTKLNRSHLVTGDIALILPCLGRTEIDEQKSGEQFVSVENSMGVVHSSQGIIPPVSEHLKSEPSIVVELAKAVFGAESIVDWEPFQNNYDAVRDAIEQTISGFDDYNKRVRIPKGFYLPNGARDGKFNTPSGKAVFTINSMPKITVAEAEYLMMTVRSHDQYNTTIYGNDDRYRGIYEGRRIVMMNEQDMAEAGLKTQDLVNLHSHFKGIKRTVEAFRVVPYPIPKNCICTYFPEANPLVPIDSYAKGSLTPCSKLVRVRIGRRGLAF